MSSGSSQRMFQLKLDPLTGNYEWVIIEEEDGDEPTFHQPLLATTSYLDMLNDSTRNTAFRQAIEKTITKPCHVLDIGAGTGLLSMMASRAMGGEGTVTACESYLPMVKLMKKVMRLNGIEGRIKVINKRSDEIKVGLDISSRADVLVSEILDSELLGEGLIPTLQHAHDNLLVENPLTVPYRATTYGQLVESTYLWRLHDLNSNEASSYDGVQLAPPGLESVLSVKRQQYAMHCDSIGEELKPLSEPFKIFEFDFWKRPESYGETELRVKATDDGRVHAVVSWWELQLDREGTVYYSTAPGWIRSTTATSPVDWCDHWKQCVWFVPGSGISVFRGEEVHLHATHDDTSISYELDTLVSRSEVLQHGLTPGDFQLVIPPERAAIYGDKGWRLSMFKAVENVLQGRSRSLCLVADDSVYLPLLVAKLSEAPHVISSFPGLKERGLQYLQAAARANNLSPNCIKAVEKGFKNLAMHDTNQKKVDLLIAEPFYFGQDGMLPWQNLRFWKDRTTLDYILSEDAMIVPNKGILRACAIYLPDLWKSRCCLSKIEGFDHSVVNATLGACGQLPELEEGPCLPFFLWQCGEFDVLSETFDVMEFDFTKRISQCQGKSQVKFTKTGVCHGFVLWIDWVMELQSSVVISTGPDKRYWKQGIKLLATPRIVGPQGLTNPQVSEILDSELLGEGLIPTLQHAHDNLLVENPQTVPYRATTYGQLVESTYLWRLHDLNSNEASSFDGVQLAPPGFESVLSVKRQQYAMHCDSIGEELKPLSEPFKIFEFDFWKRPESYGETELRVKATDDGRVHAVVSWWELQLDREGTIYYSTAPGWIRSTTATSPVDWCDHWKQCVWFVPGSGIPVFRGEEVHLHATHDDTSISYDLDTLVSRSEVLQHGFTLGDFQLVIPPERAAIYGDKGWRLSMLKAVENVLQGRSRSLCLVADDSVYLPLLVAMLSEAPHVISSFPGLKERGLQYLQAAARANNLSPNCIKAVEKGFKKLAMHDTNQKKVDLLIAEPFYFGQDGMLPWQNLRFWKDRTTLDYILSEDAMIVPNKGILRACAIYLPDLWKSRCCLSKIEGFDHSVVNATLGACGQLPELEEGPCLPFFLWQCGEFDVLSETFDVMEFDFTKRIGQCQGKSQVKFTKSGVCHGFVLWIDWVMDSQSSVVISTGPDKRYWKQGIKLLATPRTVGPQGLTNPQASCSAALEAFFDPSNGELQIIHDFL